MGLIGLIKDRKWLRNKNTIEFISIWEQDDRKPHGLALVMLNLVKKAPDTVLNVLNS
jgi:hypothetical protein